VLILFGTIFAIALVAFLVATRASRNEKVTLERVNRVKTADSSIKKAVIAHHGRHETFSAFSAHIDLLIQRGAVPMDRIPLYGLSVAAGVAGALLAWIFIPTIVFEIAGAVVGVASPYIYLRVMGRRRLSNFNKVLPDTIDLISRAVKAGHSVQVAFEIAASDAQEPVKSELAVLSGQLSFGLSQDQALKSMGDRVPSADLRFLITALLIQKQTGGSLPQILERTTHMIRERVRINGELKVKTAQGRLSATILVLLPILLAVGMKIINPAWLEPLFTETIGHYMLYYAAVSLSIGAFCVYVITKPEF
jgi:tight adherence protein B